MILLWITAHVSFFGLTLNAQAIVGSLSVNLIVLGIMDAAANLSLVFISPRVRRRTLISFIFALEGVLLLCSGLLQHQNIDNASVTALTFMAKFCASMSVSLAYLFTAEMYPTSCRALGFALCTGCGRLASSTLPFIVNGESDVTLFIIKRKIKLVKTQFGCHLFYSRSSAWLPRW